MRARIAVLLTIAPSLMCLTGSGSAIAGEANPAFTPSANEILPDSAFTAATMSTAAEIQGYLETNWPQGCLTHYMAPEPINYFEYNSSKLVPASQVVAFAAAYAEQVSGRIPLTMLQEQELLVEGNGAHGCTQVGYETAMGYNCPGPEVEPKTGTCVEEPDNVGFSEQVVKGTWQLEFGFQRSQGDANLGWGENNTVCYHGSELAGSRQRCEQDSPETFTGEYTFSNTPVTLANAATATLYAYTPALQPFGHLYLEMFGSVPEEPAKEPTEEPPVEEKPTEEKPAEKPTEPPTEKEAVKETPQETTPLPTPSGTPTGMESAAPLQVPAGTTANPLLAPKPVAKPKPKAKPKKVCRKHGKKVRCPARKKTHRKKK